MSPPAAEAQVGRLDLKLSRIEPSQAQPPKAVEESKAEAALCTLRAFKCQPEKPTFLD